jgi:hypothetical protein
VRLVQLRAASGNSRVAAVDGDRLRLLRDFTSVYELARAALEHRVPLIQAIRDHLSGVSVDYDAIYERRDPEWRVLPPFTHPEPARCLVSGTGLTHKASADNRQAMHKYQGDVSDSARMYLAGVEAGRPAPGEIGVAPEWFYKGGGNIVRAHGDPLVAPSYGDDGGEEPEIAGVYVVDDQGWPRRVGMTTANEFSDHVLEKRNYLYLAHSKLRTCSMGPELVVDPDFRDVRGTVAIERDGETLWSQPVATGEANMSHSLANLEHHHFKYDVHRRPGDAHIHFFGADAFSFGAGLRLSDGDVMVVSFEGFGRALRNPIQIERRQDRLVTVEPL